GVGWFHRDSPYRDSAALDLLEALRPEVDRYVAGILRTRTFSRKEFIELPDGQVRIGTSLARMLAASTLANWERAAASPAEVVARLVATGASSRVVVRTRLTQADRRRGRNPKRASPRTIVSACRMCGVVLDKTDRRYCGECLPRFDKGRTARLSKAGKSTLAAMRASPNDPARSAEA